MANQEHLEILQQGIDVWNQWRRDNSHLRPNLLKGYLRGAKLRNANLEGTNLIEADLIKSDLRGTNLKDVNLARANLIDANLNGADLTRATLDHADLSKASLMNANLECAKLENANLSDVDLTEAHLYGADLSNTVLTRVNLRCANLERALLIHTNLTLANLKETNFKNSRLQFTIFAFTDLTQAKNLETCEYGGPCSIDYYTLMRSRNIFRGFLKSNGLSSLFIDYLPSFQTDTWQFYTCFVSSTERDNEFSLKLYQDLKESGIKCWRWQENAAWGSKVRREVDQAISTFDKLVVICSKDSLKSPQVIREIERAVQKEDELHKDNPEVDVLFPLRLDDYIFKWKHYLKSYLLENIVADFRGWVNQEKYRESLERLIAALKKAGESFS